MRLIFSPYLAAIEGELDLLNIFDEQPVFRVLAAHNEFAFRSDAPDGGVDGEGEYKRISRVALLSSLLDAQVVVTETQDRIAYKALAKKMRDGECSAVHPGISTRLALLHALHASTETRPMYVGS